MAIRKILTIGDEFLRKKAKPVVKFDDRLWTLLDDMAQTMEEAPGVGLAAPQVGILRQVVVVNIGEGLIELINPVITHKSGVQCGPEGCLSVPGRQGVVARPYKIKVEGVNRKGEPFSMEAEGFLARAIAHEVDHLQGQMYVDIMDEELYEDGDDWEDVIDKVCEKYEGAIKDE